MRLFTKNKILFLSVLFALLLSPMLVEAKKDWIPIGNACDQPDHTIECSTSKLEYKAKERGIEVIKVESKI